MKWGLCAPSVVTVVVLAFGGIGCRSAGAPPVPPAAAGAESTAVDDAAAIYSAEALPIPEFGYSAREGRALYRHYCLNCHGDEGEGDGFNAYNLDPRPRSLADSAFQARHSDADLLAAIRSGGGAVGLSTGMPPWGRTLSERQMQDVVEYLRTLAGAEHRQP
ncbi:MAG: cytochrome c [Candidatus Eisenbacteria bacterium]|nr:cytochrome c [Candidatus Eisenbacteria bacterium]